jgi:hypothetical protein
MPKRLPPISPAPRESLRRICVHFLGFQLEHFGKPICSLLRNDMRPAE